MIREVNKALDDYKRAKQDVYESGLESYKPIFESQSKIKETIDEKQDKAIAKHDELIDKLKRGQTRIVEAIEYLDSPYGDDSIPRLYETEALEYPLGTSTPVTSDDGQEKKKFATLNPDAGIGDESREIIKANKWPLPSEAFNFEDEKSER